jgi:hypothetical protein
MKFLVYRLSDKRIIRELDDYGNEAFFRNLYYEKQSNFSGTMRPAKITHDFRVCCISDAIIVKRNFRKYIVKHGAEQFLIPPEKSLVQRLQTVLLKCMRNLRKTFCIDNT